MTVDEISWEWVREEIRASLYDDLPDDLNDLEMNALAGVLTDKATEAARLAVLCQKGRKEQECPPGTTA